MEEFVTIPEIIARAKQTLPPFVWDTVSGGSETETTLRRNRAGIESLAFRTRVLRGVERRSLSTTFLGHELGLPVMVAPVGGLIRMDPGAALTACKVTKQFQTATFLSAVAHPTIEDMAACDGLKFFQLYCYGDRDWCLQLVRRAENAGFSGLCVTVDTAVYGRRDRDIENRFKANERRFANFDKHERVFAERLTWDDIDHFREQTRLPMMIKGIMTAEDARLCVEHGIDVVYVSNHGGRQLDHQPSTIEMLPEIVEAVAGRAEIIVDGGFVRGSDVLKALALGARAVLIGKLACYGLAAGGEAGLTRVFELLRDELMVDTALLGVNRLSELDPSFVRPVTPV